MSKCGANEQVENCYKSWFGGGNVEKKKWSESEGESCRTIKSDGFAPEGRGWL